MSNISILFLIIAALLLFALVAHRKSMQTYKPNYMYRTGSGSGSNLSVVVIIVFIVVIMFLMLGLRIELHPAVFAILFIITLFLGSRANKHTVQQKKILYDKEQRANRKNNHTQ